MIVLLDLEEVSSPESAYEFAEITLKQIYATNMVKSPHGAL